MTYSATLLSSHRMTPNVKQFRLAADEPFEFRPGQHTTVRFEDDGDEVVRPYTATNLPGTDQLTLAIKRYDDGTASVYMHERERGDEVTLGPLEGNLHLRDADEDVAFVSTGTGITPMMSMLKEYLRAGSGTAHFFHGEKSPEHLIYRETLEQLAAQNGNLDVTFVCSDAAWNGPTGHVQEHLTDRLDSLSGHHYYVCGVPEMVVETTTLLEDEGVDEDTVFTEGWEEGEGSEE